MAIFEDFAGEAVTLCRQSLSIAATRLAQEAQSTQLDGQLFTIRHFLILREMVASVDLVHIERAADFSSMTGGSRPAMRVPPDVFARRAQQLAMDGLVAAEPICPFRVGLALHAQLSRNDEGR
jgi:hypothetical protein